ncbi:MAG: NAD(P)/FAD-dependent oxidoreductase [Caldimonas sp.]
MDRVDAVVVGAGVVGLAVGRALAGRGLDTLIVEAEAGIGSGISSRNSEVIHAGLYDSPTSLKARLCVAGREALYPYCESRGIGHRRCGKLVVATSPAQLPALDAIERSAAANGVSLRRLDAGEAMAMEPALRCDGALLSSVTGIIDSHALMLAYLGDFERAGGVLALRSRLDSASVSGGSIVVRVGGADGVELETSILVNAAGLQAPQLARRIDGLSPSFVPTPHFAKGNYFSLTGRSPFTRLVYPVPEPGGLGVHLTLDLGGQARFGPDVEWLAVESADAIDYGVDPARGARFEAAIRRYWPGLPADALAPGYSGVRPKLSGPGEAASDFVLQGPEDHGVAGLMNLYGIESPGLTASHAIADEVIVRLGLAPRRT